MARKRNDVHVGPISRAPASRNHFGFARVPRSVLLRGTALQGVVVLCSVMPVDYVWAQATNAHPTNPVTQLGSGSYNYNGTTTTINQTSNVLATGWSSFNVGSAQSVRINQPNAASVSVNRVAVGDPSRIAGHINANGVFVLVNPSGVVFSRGAQVNAASVIVSTADSSNRNLAAGKLIFDRPGRPGAMIINNGNITVRQTGLAALVAPGVVNAGVINAPMGRVALAGGQASVVDLYGDGLMSIDVTRQVTTVPTGPDGKPVTALVTNTGVITATGGRVQLTAKAVDGIVTTLVDAGGKISANTSKSGQTGTIVVDGIGGSLTIEGDISAAGKAPGTKGGAVELNASNAVNLTATARVNVSGKAGGGTAAIGTTLARAAGGQSVTGQPTAKSVAIAAGARINASATRKGKGGTVTILSTDDTSMAGAIVATGGKLGGDGGFVEVSGYQNYSLTGDINVGAPVGKLGSILIDPDTLTVVNSGTGSLDGVLDAGSTTHTILPSDGGTSDTVSSAEIDSLHGNIILQAGSLLQISNNTSLALESDANLSLASGGDITIGTNSAITASGTGSITLTAGTTTTGSISLGSNLTTDTGTGTVTMVASGSIALGGVTITTSTLDMTTTGTGNITQSTGGVVSVGTLQSTGSISGSISLLGTGNAISVLKALSVTGNATLVNGTTLTVAGVTSVGNGNSLSVTAPRLILGTSGGVGELQATGGTVSVSTDRLSVASGGGTLDAGSAGVVEIAPSTSIGIAFGAGVTFTAGTLAVDPSAITINAGTLRLGQDAGHTVATSIAVAEDTNLTHIGTVDFESTGALTQTGFLGGAAISGTLSSVVLNDAANSVSSVGNLTGTNGVTLTNGAPLPINGVISASSGTVDLTATSNLLTVTGTINAKGATLNAGTILVPGAINLGTTGLANLVATDSVVGIGNLSLGTLTGSAVNAFALTGTNAIGTLGAISGIGVTIDNAASLTIAGLVDANGGSAVINNGSLGLTLAHLGTVAITGANAIDINAGSIALNGVITASNAAATVTLTAGQGAITQAGTGIITAGTLTGTAATSAQFAGTANAVANLASFSAPGGFSLVDTVILSQSGVLNGGTNAVGIDVGQNLLALNGTILGGSATLNTGTLVFEAGSSLGVTGLAMLNAGTANIDQTNGFISAGTLAGSAFSTAVFSNGASIGNLGSFITGSGFTLAANTASLTVAGLIRGGTGSVVFDNGTNGFAIGSGGSIIGSSVAITAGSIDLNGGITDPNTLLLIANTGSIAQTGTAPFSIGTLTGSAVTDATFLATNTVATLGSFTAGGTFALTDGRALAVNNLVTGSVIALTTPSLTMDDGTVAGTLAATSLVSIRTGTLAAAMTGDVISAGSTGTLEIAPRNSGDTLVLGTGTGGAGTLVVDAANGNLTLTYGTLRLGAIGTTALAGGIAIDAAITGTLDLETTAAGIVTQDTAAGAALTLASLTGTVGAMTLGNTANAIAAIGNLTATNGATIANTGSVTLSGALLANSGTVVLTGNDVVNLTGSLSAKAATLVAGTIVIPGTLNTTNQALLSSTAAGIIATGGVLNIGTLTGGAATNATFDGTNAIGTLAAFSATALVLNNGSADLTVAGSVAVSSSITLTTTGSIAVPGTIASSAGAITVGLTAGPSISITGALSDSGSGSTTLVTNAGTVTGTGTVAIGTLSGSSAVLALIGSNISVGTLSAYTATSALTLIDATPLTAIGANGGGSLIAIQVPMLTLGDGTNSGTLIAEGGIVSVRADGLAVGGANEGTIDAGASGVFELSGSGATSIALGVASSTGTLGINLGSLSVTAGTLRLGSFNGVTDTDSISIAGSGDLHSQFGTLDLRATGAVTQSDALVVETLIGSAGTVILANSNNSIATLGSFTSTGDFTLASSVSLSVTGILSSGGSVVLDTGNAGLGVATGGGVTGTAISLSAGSIDIDGSVSAQGLLTLLANAGSIAEAGTGFLGAATLTGSAASYASLMGTNAVTTVAGFSAVQGFTLTNASDLTQTGLLDSHNGTVAISTGSHTLSIDGTITAVAAALTAGAIIEAGTAALNAGTLTGSVTTLANLQGNNSVAQLGDFTAGTLLLNAGGIGLDVTGPVTIGNSMVLTDTGSIQVSGTIIAAAGSDIAISLSGSTLDIAGLLNDGGAGATSLFSTGIITETGTLIAGTLSGSAVAADLSSANNSIGTLGSFTAGTLLLNDTASLTVGGVVTIGTTIAITDASTIDITGTIAPSSGGTIGVGLTAGTGGAVIIDGLVSDGGNGSLSLVADAGSITEPLTGKIIAGTISGTADIVALLGTANAIAVLNGLSGTSTLAVTDTGPLTIASNINNGSLIAFTSNTLTISGSLTAPDVTLVATTSTLAINGGTIDASGTTSLNGAAGVDAHNGVIIGDGSVIAISANGLVDLTNTGNIVAGVGGSANTAFAARSGTVLTVTDVTAGTAITIGSANALVVSGTVAPATGVTAIAVGLTGTSITLGTTAQVSDGGAGTTSLVATTGDVTEAAATVLNSGTLSGFSGGGVTLNGGNSVHAIGSFTATTGFALTNGSSLSIGTLTSDDAISVNQGSQSLTVAGTIQGGGSTPISLNAGAIDINGGIGQGALTLASTGSIAGAGALNVISLQGSAGTFASLTGTNSIATLNDFTVGNGFTLANAANLSVAGQVSTGSGTVLINNGSLALDIGGGISADAVALTAGTIGLTGIGSLTANDIASLTAASVHQDTTAFLNAGTLIGMLTGAGSLLGHNLIATLGIFNAGGGLTLTNGENLSVAGPVSASGGTIVLDTGNFDLGIPGSVSALAATLTAGNIALGGSLNVSGTADLVASVGSIAEMGGLTAGLLTGSAVSTASFTGTNFINSLGNFSAPGGLTVTDGTFLTVSGLASASGGTVLVNTGTFGLSVTDGISGQAATISAGSIDVSGSLSAGTKLALVASVGSIAVPGNVNTGTLTGSAVTTASFSGTNAIATLGIFAAPSGFSLSDAADLSIVGPVSSSNGAIDINAGNFHLTDPGLVSGQSVTLAAGSIDISGSLHATLVADLIASTGSIAVPGNVNAGTLTGSAFTTASFTAGTNNAIATLANFTAPDGFTLDDGEALSVSGNVAASSGAIQINTYGFGLGVTGGLSGQSATLNASAINNNGSIGITGTLDLVASTGSISSTGSLSAGTLTGSAATTAAFTGADFVATLAAFSAPTGFTLDNRQALSVAGSVAASGGAVTLNTGGALLSLAPTGAITGQAADLTGGTVAIAGSVGVSGLVLLSAGTIAETGSISAGTLAGTATLASLTGANQIGILGSFTAGSLTLDDGHALTVAGPVGIGSSIAITDTGLIAVTGSIAPTAGNIAVALNGGTLAITGLVSDGGAGTTSLLATDGTITETTGTLVAGTLTGGADTALLNGPSNHIAALGNFAAGPTLVLTDLDALTQTGSLTASSLLSLTASTLTTNGLISAPQIALVATAGTLGLSGTVNATTSAILTGQQGIAGASVLLSGGGTVTATSSLGAVTLTNALNAVTGIDGSAGTSFSVKDSDSATVQAITAGGSVSIVDTSTLTVAGSIAPLAGGTAIAIGLTAGSITISGLLNDGGAGTTTLTSTQGVTETGGIIAGTLSASGASLNFSSTNTVAALGDISGDSTFVFGDTVPLRIAGNVSASTLVAITAPALTVSGVVIAPTTELIAVSGTLGLTGTVSATTAAILDGAAGIFGSTGLVTGEAALTANSNSGSVTLTNAGNDVASVIGNAAGSYAFVNSGGVSLGNLSAGTTASVSATAIGVAGTLGAANVILAASTGNITVTGSVIPSTSGTLTAINGTISVASGGAITPPTGVAAIRLALDARQISIAGLVSDGGAGTTSLIVPLNSGTIQETGTLVTGALSGSALLANLIDAGFSNRIATLAAFNAGTLNLNDGVALTVAGPVSIDTSVQIDDTAALSVPGVIAPSGAAIAASLTGASISIGGEVTSGGGSMVLNATSGGIAIGGAVSSGSLVLTATGGGISETGVLIASTLSGSANGGDVALAGANQIGVITGFTTTGNLLIDDGISLLVNGAVLAGTGGASPSLAEIDVLGAGASLTIASGAIVQAGIDGASTGNVTLRAGNDSLAGSVIINGGVYASNGGAVAVTAGYNVGSNAWNVVGSGSSITLTGTIWGDRSLANVAGQVSLGAANTIDESSAAAMIGASVLTGRSGGFANFGETAGGALAFSGSNNRIAALAGFVSNAGGADNAQGFLLRDGQSLTITGPVIDEGATNSRGVAISIVPPGYAPGNLTIASEVATNTTANLQATGSITEVAGGSVIARTLTTQAGVIPSTEAAGNVAGNYPATVTAAAASAFYGNASSRNANQIGTLVGATTTGTLSLFDALNLTVAGNLMTGVTPAGTSIAGTIAIGTGMTLVSPGVISIGGTLDVASQGGVMSIAADTVVLGNSFGSATLKASTIQVFAASGATLGDNTVIDTGGDVFKRPFANTAPIDPGAASQGAHFLVGSGGFTQNGQLIVGAYSTPLGVITTTHPELDIRLTTGAGAIKFDPNLGLNAPTTSLLLSLGSSGSVSGKVNADDIAVFYTGTNGNATQILATLHTSAGVQVSGQVAASQAFIAENGAFVPNNHFQVNACSISSINCILISPFATVPVVNPLANLPTEFLTDESDDPDLLIPNVTDQED